jgi:hypothetical protein
MDLFQGAERNGVGNGHKSPSMTARIGVAIAIGIVCGSTSFLTTRLAGFRGQDFWVLWYGARALLEGRNPYTTIVWSGGGFGFRYPLSTALLTIPLSGLPPNIAGSLYIALSCALLAFACTRRAWWPLLLFLSGSMIQSVRAAQLSPLLTFGLLTPAAMWLGALKPNIGLAMLAYRPSARAALTMLIVSAIALISMPSWPLDWVATVRASPVHYSPLRTLGGPLLLLALLRWRRAEARLLTAMAVVPSSPIVYEALPLFLVPTTWKQMTALVILSDLAYLVTRPTLRDGTDRSIHGPRSVGDAVVSVHAGTSHDSPPAK